MTGSLLVWQADRVVRSRRRTLNPLTSTSLSVLLLTVAAACSGGSDTDSTTVPTSVAATTTTVEITVTEPVPTPSTPSSEPTTTVAPTTTAAPTTTTEPLVTDGAVVIVANAAAIPGAARLVTGQLQGFGFTVAEPTNAAGVEARLDRTKVYFLPGSEEVARSIVRLFGDAEFAAMPTPVWIDGANEALGDATVVVMLGRDHGEIGIPPR
jgi:hypothetical protein